MVLKLKNRAVLEQFDAGTLRKSNRIGDSADFLINSQTQRASSGRAHELCACT